MHDVAAHSQPGDPPAPEFGLLGEVLDLTSSLDLDKVLRELVHSASRITGARYSAVGVLDSRGETMNFVQHGMTAQEERALGHPPRGHGVLGAIPADGALVLEDLTTHPAFGGWPAGHPEMHTFLGVPVRVGDRVYGRLYLAERPGGFTPENVRDVSILARAAGAAVRNSQLYADARNRERWISVSQEITTTLLEGTEEEEALQMVASRLREVADADTAIIILPSVGETWAAEFVEGHAAADLLGVVFPPDGRAMSVLANRLGVIVDSMARSRALRVPQLAQFGPALYAPMLVRDEGRGVILLLRRVGRAEFEPSDLAIAESVAGQAALALELASARHAEDLAGLLEERARIGRDLHDLAIQQLFAAGMRLEQARKDLAERGEDEAAAVVEDALGSVDDSVTQIRAIVHQLREPDTAVVLVERLRRETSLARAGLGFAPSLVLSVDGTPLRGEDPQAERAVVDAFVARVDPDVSDDVVAVVREGLANAARHARASSVQVRVDLEGDGPAGRIRVEVEDDGRGLPPDRARRSGTGNLAARSRRHGGTFSVGAAESGRGTLLVWQVPLT